MDSYNIKSTLKEVFAKSFIILCISIVFILGFNISKANAITYLSKPDWPNMGNDIYAAVIDVDGNVWAGGEGGYVAYWNGTTWTNDSNPTSSHIRDMSLGSDGKVWFAGYYDGEYVQSSYTGYWDGSSWITQSHGSNFVYSITTGIDGKIWIAGKNGLIKYWNGSSWVSFTSPTTSTITRITTSPDGRLWIGDSDGYVYYYNGSNWTATGRVFGSIYYDIEKMVADSNNNIWVITSTNSTMSYWNGNEWTNYGRFSKGDITIGNEGKIWNYHSDGADYFNGEEWIETDFAWPYSSNSLNTAVTLDNGRIFVLGENGKCAYVRTNNSLNLVESNNGATGEFIINPVISSLSGLLYPLQYSTNGTDFSDLGIPNNGTISLSPTTNTAYIRATLKRELRKGVFEEFYSSVVTINPILNFDTNIQSEAVTWSNTQGKSNITISWDAVTNADGYRLWIFDGNEYKSCDLGNVLSWNSSDAMIFPFPGELPEDNSISTDLFRWDGSGVEFDDKPSSLFKSTIGTSYDSDTKYRFKVTAYNDWMETKHLYQTSRVELAQATDKTNPSAILDIITAEGLEKTASRDVILSLEVTDAGSGVKNVGVSNDGVSYSNVYEEGLLPDNSTGVYSYIDNVDWTLTAGAGTKTVYIKVIDAVENEIIISKQVALADDIVPPDVTITINNGAESTTNALVDLYIDAFDSSSTEDKLKMRFSNDGSLWSVWESYSIDKVWDINNVAYGGNSDVGIKTVYIQIADAAQNISFARDTIGYNDTLPAGNITIIGGNIGTFNGIDALYCKTNSPTLLLDYPTATSIRIDKGLGIWGEWETYSANYPVYLLSSSGGCLIRVQVKDVYGVAGDADHYVLVIDTQSPVITSLKGQNGATVTSSSTMNLSIEYSDNMADLTYSYNVNEGDWSVAETLSGNTITVSGLSAGANTINVKAIDKAGNTTEKSLVIFML